VFGKSTYMLRRCECELLCLLRGIFRQAMCRPRSRSNFSLVDRILYPIRLQLDVRVAGRPARTFMSRIE